MYLLGLVIVVLVFFPHYEDPIYLSEMALVIKADNFYSQNLPRMIPLGVCLGLKWLVFGLLIVFGVFEGDFQKSKSFSP